MKVLPLLISTTLMTSCSIAPTYQEMQSHYYGPRPSTESAHAAVISHMQMKLIDPDSGKYQCGSPRKGGAWTCEGGESCGNRVGYIVECLINGRNRFGGYTGNQKYYFMLQGDPNYPEAFDLSIHPHWIRFIEQNPLSRECAIIERFLIVSKIRSHSGLCKSVIPHQKVDQDNQAPAAKKEYSALVLRIHKDPVGLVKIISLESLLNRINPVAGFSVEQVDSD